MIFTSGPMAVCFDRLFLHRLCSCAFTQQEHIVCFYILFAKMIFTSGIRLPDIIAFDTTLASWSFLRTRPARSSFGHCVRRLLRSGSARAVHRQTNRQTNACTHLHICHRQTNRQTNAEHTTDPGCVYTRTRHVSCTFNVTCMASVALTPLEFPPEGVLPQLQ